MIFQNKIRKDVQPVRLKFNNLLIVENSSTAIGVCYCVSVCESVSHNYVCFWIMKNLNSMASSIKKRNDKYNVKQNQEENP